MDPSSAIATLLSLISDLLITKGGQLITGGVYVGGRYITSHTMDHFNFYGTGRKKKLRGNRWIRFLKLMRKVYSSGFNVPDRVKIAKELYRKLRESGQLDFAIKHGALPLSIVNRLESIFVIKPTENLKSFIWDDARFFAHKGKLYEKSPTKEISEVGTFEKTTAPLITRVIPREKTVEFIESYGHPLTSENIEEKAQAEATKSAQKESAIENIQETIHEAVNESSLLPANIAKENVKQAIEQTQRDLLTEGNLFATDADVLVNAAAQAAASNPNKALPVVESVSELTAVSPNEIILKANEIKTLIEKVMSTVSAQEKRISVLEKILEPQIKQAQEEEEEKEKQLTRLDELLGQTESISVPHTPEKRATEQITQLLKEEEDFPLKFTKEQIEKIDEEALKEIEDVGTGLPKRITPGMIQRARLIAKTLGKRKPRITRKMGTKAKILSTQLANLAKKRRSKKIKRAASKARIIAREVAAKRKGKKVGKKAEELVELMRELQKSRTRKRTRKTRRTRRTGTTVRKAGKRKGYRKRSTRVKKNMTKAFPTPIPIKELEKEVMETKKVPEDLPEDVKKALKSLVK